MTPGGPKRPHHPAPRILPIPYFYPYYEPYPYIAPNVPQYPYATPYIPETPYYYYPSPRGVPGPWPDTQAGNVLLRIEPSDVQVYVNGTRYPIDGQGTLLLPLGRWHLDFVHPGYRTETLDLEVISGVSYRIERHLQPLSTPVG